MRTRRKSVFFNEAREPRPARTTKVLCAQRGARVRRNYRNGRRRAGLSDDDLAWFARDRRGDATEAAQKAAAYVAWRRNFGGLGRDRDALLAKAEPERRRRVGYLAREKDALGRPVVVVVARRHDATRRRMPESQALCLATLEDAVRNLEHGCEQVLAVVDLKDVGPQQVDVPFLLWLVATLRARAGRAGRKYFRRADLPWMNRGDAAGATWIFRGDAAAATWIFRGDRLRRWIFRGDAAAATWIFRGDAATWIFGRDRRAPQVLPEAPGAGRVGGSAARLVRSGLEPHQTRGRPPREDGADRVARGVEEGIFQGAPAAGPPLRTCLSNLYVLSETLTPHALSSRRGVGPPPAGAPSR